MRLLRLQPILLWLALVLACTRTTADQPGGEKAAVETPSAAADKIAATVQGESISDAEVTAAVDRQLQGRRVAPEIAQNLREAVLKMLIDQRLVDQFIAEKKIETDPKQIDSVIEKIRKQVAAAGLSFEEVLKMEGHTAESLRKRIGADLAFQKYSESAVTDAEVKQYYESHKEELDGAEVQASHLLIKVENGASDEEKTAAAAKIKAIRQEIVAGLDFAEAAKKYSACPSSSEGGDLGTFPRHGKMVEPFAAAAFDLKVGELSPPVETPFGWHLIKVTDRLAGGKGLEEVQDEVKEILQRQLWDKTAAERREGAKIEIR
ncbi:MAG: hypothetical protein GXY83_14625 [Rhodopirellula sp.]|nr:hypothetical protein [Rhodopirellula sp.]